MDRLQDILKDTAEYVAWKLESGESTAEVGRAILDDFAAGAVISRKRGSAAAAPGTPGAKTVTPATAPQPLPPSRGKQTSSAPAEHPAVGRGAADVHTSPVQALAEIADVVRGCTLCPLHDGRTQAVPGQGHPQPEILFVGEAPGADEDAQGLAFVGRAGQLLTKMIEAMGFSRETVFIANVNKCRPPNNRKPLREEMDACLPYLRQQVAILQPKVIVALGATAVEGLVPASATQKISQLRGKWMSFAGIPLMPTYHPAYLLRNPAMKKPVWQDLQEVLRKLGRPVPAHGSAR